MKLGKIPNTKVKTAKGKIIACSRLVISNQTRIYFILALPKTILL
jgi:hypothetical protein